MKLPEVDDWLPELPPLDGVEGEENAPIASDELDEDLDIPDSSEQGRDDDPDDTFDIGEPIDLTGVESSSNEGSEINDDHDDSNDRIGEVDDSDLVGNDTLLGQDDDAENGPADVEIDVSDEVADGQVGDPNDVGPGDSIESFLEGELPPMDADDAGDFEDELLRETDLILGIAAQPHDGQPDADLAWHELETFVLPVPLHPDDIDTTVLIEPDTHDAAVIVTPRLGVVRITNGRPPASRNLWRELGGTAGQPPEPQPHPQAERLIACLGTDVNQRVIWLATPKGRLLRGESYGTTWEHCAPLPGMGYRALSTRADGSLVLLRSSATDMSLVVSTDLRSWFEHKLPLAANRFDKEEHLWIATAGQALAVGGPSGGVALSRDGGRTFHELAESTGAILGTFAGDGPTAALVVALHHKDRPRLLLTRTSERDELEFVAQVDPGRDARPAPLPPPIALVWDRRGHAWVWWNGCLSAWGPRTLQ